MWVNWPTLLFFKSFNFPVAITGMISEPQREILIKLGRRIASLRKSKNLSFRKMALHCDLDYSDIKKFEKGEVNITFLTMVELAKGLGVSVKELMDFWTVSFYKPFKTQRLPVKHQILFLTFLIFTFITFILATLCCLTDTDEKTAFTLFTAGLDRWIAIFILLWWYHWTIHHQKPDTTRSTCE